MYGLVFLSYVQMLSLFSLIKKLSSFQPNEKKLTPYTHARTHTRHVHSFLFCQEVGIISEMVVRTLHSSSLSNNRKSHEPSVQCSNLTKFARPVPNDSGECNDTSYTLAPSRGQSSNLTSVNCLFVLVCDGYTRASE